MNFSNQNNVKNVPQRCQQHSNIVINQQGILPPLNKKAM